MYVSSERRYISTHSSLMSFDWVTGLDCVASRVSGLLSITLLGYCRMLTESTFRLVAAE